MKLAWAVVAIWLTVSVNVVVSSIPPVAVTAIFRFRRARVVCWFGILALIHDVTSATAGKTRRWCGNILRLPKHVGLLHYVIRLNDIVRNNGHCRRCVRIRRCRISDLGRPVTAAYPTAKAKVET